MQQRLVHPVSASAPTHTTAQDTELLSSTARGDHAGDVKAEGAMEA